METGLVIFLIWLAIAAIGVVSSIKKKTRQAEIAQQQKRPEDDIERRLREIHEKLIRKEPAPEQPEADFSSEGERAVNVEPPQSPAAAAPAAESKPASKPEPAKKDGMDFDAEEMVIYSEIMKPGYEKY